MPKKHKDMETSDMKHIWYRMKINTFSVESADSRKYFDATE